MWDAHYLIYLIGGGLGAKEPTKKRQCARCTLRTLPLLMKKRQEMRRHVGCTPPCHSAHPPPPSIFFRHHFFHPISPYHPPPYWIQIRAMMCRLCWCHLGAVTWRPLGGFVSGVRGCDVVPLGGFVNVVGGQDVAPQPATRTVDAAGAKRWWQRVNDGGDRLAMAVTG